MECFEKVEGGRLVLHYVHSWEEPPFSSLRHTAGTEMETFCGKTGKFHARSFSDPLPWGGAPVNVYPQDYSSRVAWCPVCCDIEAVYFLLRHLEHSGT